MLERRPWKDKPQRPPNPLKLGRRGDDERDGPPLPMTALNRPAALLAAALLTVPAAAQKPARPGPGPSLGPDFTPMLAEITPGLPGVVPTVVDVALPPLLPVPGPELAIEPGGHLATEPIAIGPRGADLTPSERELLARPWVVNINTAPAALLAQMPGFDALRAEAVVHFRETVGPFEQSAHISRVFGVSQEMYAILAGHLVCRGESTYQGPPSALATGGP
ncbi:MAG: helix-hairpin-helix domain-containing protein [Candidatus Sumerlaeia bacterium]|nr:helix-hairpin-helix domain-containing protein [Candidatus Sumerlaeia bacterium]